VLDSGSDLSAGKLHYLADRALTGHSSPNMQLPMYFDGSVVRTTDGRKQWLGVVTLNPGGVNYFAAPDFKPVWGHFTHAPIHCHCLCDVNGDGTPEVLVGREDGFVVQYSLAGGRVMNRVFAGGEVRAIAASGNNIVVATSEGLLLLNLQLQTLGLKRGAVQSMRVLESSPSGPPRIAVAFDHGAVGGMTIPPHLRPGPSK
jgi:hypothetical protein